MTERDYTKLGLFLIVGIGLAIAAAVFYGMQGQDRETLDYVTYFDEPVGGLKVGAPVRFRGVDIGVVDHIAVAPGDTAWIEVGFEVYVQDMEHIGIDVEALRKGHQRTEAPPDLPARVKQQGNPVTGIATLLIDIPKDPPPIAALPFEPPRPYVPSMPSTGTQLSDALDQLATKLPAVLGDLDRLILNADRAMNDARLGQLSAKALTVLDRFDVVLGKLDGELDGLDASHRSEQLGRLVVASTEAMTNADANLERLLGPEGQLEHTLRDIRVAIDQIETAETAAALRQGLSRAGRALDSVTILARDAEVLVPAMDALLLQLRGLIRTLNDQPEALLFGPAQPEETP